MRRNSIGLSVGEGGTIIIFVYNSLCILFTDEHFVPTCLTILQFYNSNKNMGIKESLEQIHNSVRTIVYSRAQLRSYIYL